MDKHRKALLRVVMAAFSAATGFFMATRPQGWSEHQRVALGVVTTVVLFGLLVVTDLGADKLRKTAFFSKNNDAHVGANRVGAAIGTVLGLVGGIVLVWHIGVHKTTFMLVPLGALISATAFGYLVHFAQNMHEATDDKSGGRVRKAAVVGAVLGLLLTAYVIASTALTWPFAFIGAGLGAAAIGGLWQHGQIVRENKRYHSKRLEAAISNPEPARNNVAAWKLPIIKTLMEAGDENIVAASDLHWVGLLWDEKGPLFALFLIYWKSADFAGYDSLVAIFQNDIYTLAFLGAIVLVVLVWVRKWRKEIKRQLAQAAVTAAFIGLIWLGFHLPAKNFVSTAFQEGHPLPWLIVSVPVLLWGGYRALKWACFALVNTGQRLILTWLLPWPLRKKQFDMGLPTNAANPSDPVYGRIVGCGTAAIDGASQEGDKEYHLVRFLLGHRRFTNSVLVKKKAA